MYALTGLGWFLRQILWSLEGFRVSSPPCLPYDLEVANIMQTSSPMEDCTDRPSLRAPGRATMPLDADPLQPAAHGFSYSLEGYPVFWRLNKTSLSAHVQRLSQALNANAGSEVQDVDIGFAVLLRHIIHDT